MTPKMHNTLWPGAVLSVSLLLASGATLAEIAIIANPVAGAGELDKKTAKKLFLGKISTIPGMDKVTLVGQADDSPTKAEFAKKVTKKKLNQFKAYWSKMVFSGKAVPPKEFANDSELKAFVARTPNAVGYVDASVVDDSVKVLLNVP